MLLVIHACIGMPMASLDCGKRFLDTNSISVKREYRQIEHLFVTDFTGSCPNDIGVEQVSFKKEVGVMVNDLIFWLTVCLILKMCY